MAIIGLGLVLSLSQSIKSILWQKVRHLPARIKEKATETAKAFGLKKSNTDYDELLKDPII